MLSKYKKTEMYQAEKQRNVLAWYLYKCMTLSKEEYVALVNEIPEGEHYVMSNYPAWRFINDIKWNLKYNEEEELVEMTKQEMIEYLEHKMDEADAEYRGLWEQNRG